MVTLSPFTSNLLMNETVKQIIRPHEKCRITGGGCGGPRHPFTVALSSRQPRFTVSFAWNEIFLPLPSSSMARKRLEMQRDHNYNSHVTALTNTLGMTNITPIQLAQGLTTVCHVESNVMALRRRWMGSIARTLQHLPRRWGFYLCELFSSQRGMSSLASLFLDGLE